MFNPRLMRLRLLLVLAWAMTGCATYSPYATPETPIRIEYRYAYLKANPHLPDDIRLAIERGDILKGFSESDVMASWGPPASCNRALGNPEGQKVCVYTDRTTKIINGYARVFEDYRSVLFVQGQAIDWQKH